MRDFESLYEHMRQKLTGIVPDFEIRLKAEVAHEVLRLKEERGAVILGHNYMEPALFHSVPDFVGDSLELSRRAAGTHADVIIFCGVRFMAETAKILSPEKTVLLPAAEAGCSLAASITAEDVRMLRRRFPGVPVVSYVNTYADVKAESDLCCTSGNAAKVLQSLGDQSVIFIPDEYLATNTALDAGRRVIYVNREKLAETIRPPRGAVIAWQGRCEVHEQFSVVDIRRAREQFAGVEVLAHPECSREVVAASDFSGSTTAMVRRVKESRAPHYLLLTECSMGDNIIAENREKDILRLCSIRCPHMHQITLEGVLRALTHNEQLIDVPEPTRSKARHAVERMLQIG